MGSTHASVDDNDNDNTPPRQRRHSSIRFFFLAMVMACVLALRLSPSQTMVSQLPPQTTIPKAIRNETANLTLAATITTAVIANNSTQQQLYNIFQHSLVDARLFCLARTSTGTSALRSSQLDGRVSKRKRRPRPRQRQRQQQQQQQQHAVVGSAFTQRSSDFALLFDFAVY